MTVAGLIEFLKQQPPDAEVTIYHWFPDRSGEYTLTDGFVPTEVKDEDAILVVVDASARAQYFRFD